MSGSAFTDAVNESREHDKIVCLPFSRKALDEALILADDNVVNGPEWEFWGGDLAEWRVHFTVTDRQIERLRAEGLVDGDETIVGFCECALDGDETAHRACAEEVFRRADSGPSTFDRLVAAGWRYMTSGVFQGPFGSGIVLRRFDDGGWTVYDRDEAETNGVPLSISFVGPEDAIRLGIENLRDRATALVALTPGGGLASGADWLQKAPEGSRSPVASRIPPETAPSLPNPA